MGYDNPLARSLAIIAYGPEAGKRLDAGLCPRCGAARKGYRDEKSWREAELSGLCQPCQDVEFRKR